MEKKENYVKLTKKLIRDRFIEYNEKYFNNEVEEPKKFEIWTPSKYCVGWVRAIWDKKAKRNFASFHISNEVNWTEKELRDVIVHEMIHCFIKDYLERLSWWKKLLCKDHDKRFIDKMNELNENFGLNVMVRSKHLRQYIKNH